MKRSPGSLSRALGALLLAPLRLYQRFISPALPRRCKYEPTCSAYAVGAIRELGPAKGPIVAGWRLLRCNPFSHGGYDPVEARTLFNPGRDADERAPHAHDHPRHAA